MSIPMFLLAKDLIYFEQIYPDAASFLRGAALRKECHDLAQIKRRNDWQERQLKELLEVPCCKGYEIL